MEQFEQYLTRGKGLGLEGKDLLQFAQEREEKKREITDREERKQREITDREERKQRENEERDERQKDRDHTKEMKELELKIAEEHARATLTPINPNTSQFNTSMNLGSFSSIKPPRLPQFKDRQDDLDSYIRRFERFSTAAGWPEADWAVSLSTLLTGRALEVYSRLPIDQASDYKQLKLALLKRYRLTEDGFREKFKLARPEAGETYAQFADRLKDYHTRWIELAGVDKEYDSLVNLIVREQVISGCSRDLAVFLRERRPTTVKEMTTLADQYTLAHSQFFDKVRHDRSKPVDSSKGKPVDSSATKPSSQGRPNDGRYQDRPRCYNCGIKGHLARDCRKPPRDSSYQVPRNKAAGLDMVKEVKEVSPPECKPIGACLKLESPCALLAQMGKPVKLACGHEIPMLSAACTVGSGMPVVKGIVGSHEVNVLRDTGCSTTVVRQGLVSRDQMIGTHSKCLLLDGTVRRYPVAKIDVDTPYFRGSVEALCMESPLYGLILGNISGVREPDNPDPEWHPPVSKSTRYEDDSVGDTVGAVQTRSQKAKEEKPFPSLKVPARENVASKDEFVREQMLDVTLDKVKKLAETGSVRVTGKANETRFVKDGDLYYREFKSPKIDKGRLFRQLAVPKVFRNQVLKLAHDSTMAGHLGAKKTSDRILANFYWPGLQGDVRRYCASCDICQRTHCKKLGVQIYTTGVHIVQLAQYEHHGRIKLTPLVSF